MRSYRGEITVTYNIISTLTLNCFLIVIIILYLSNLFLRTRSLHHILDGFFFLSSPQYHRTTQNNFVDTHDRARC